MRHAWLLRTFLRFDCHLARTGYASLCTPRNATHITCTFRVPHAVSLSRDRNSRIYTYTPYYYIVTALRPRAPLSLPVLARRRHTTERRFPRAKRTTRKRIVSSKGRRPSRRLGVIARAVVKYDVYGRRMAAWVARRKTGRFARRRSAPFLPIRNRARM